MKCNEGINCNVAQCRYNQDSRLCELTEVQISNNQECHAENSACTCCASYEEK